MSEKELLKLIKENQKLNEELKRKSAMLDKDLVKARTILKILQETYELK